MKGMISNHLSSRRMPTGRYVFAFTQILEEAREEGDEKVIKWLEKCVEHGRKTLSLEFAYEQSRAQDSSARGDAFKLDNQLDNLITAIKKLVAARDIDGQDDPVSKASRRVQDVIYPRGVAPIIRQSYEAQLATMDMMIEQFREDLDEEVELLGIDREVSRFEKLVDQFRAELRRNEVPTVSYDQVKEARNELHEYASMAEVVILAAYDGMDEETARERESLLAPYTDQQQRVLEAQRRRRSPQDVDPDTGTRLDDDADPGQERN